MLSMTILFPAIAFSAVIREGVYYKGWKCVVMRNDTTAVFVAPRLAGRIIQYRVNGRDWLWVNEELAGKVYPPEENDRMERWKNYGGDKLWPAPQGWDRPDQWPGPGDKVITAPYRYQIIKRKGKSVSLKLIGSDQGGWAGVQFSRVLTLHEGSNRLEQKITMKNVSRETVYWGIWEVTQMDWTDPGKTRRSNNYNDQAYIAVPMNPDSRWPEKYHVMFGLASSFNWQPDYEHALMKARYSNFVGKIVMDVPAGWAAMVDPISRSTYVQRFPYDPEAEYPDGGNFEVWVAGKGEFVHKNERMWAKDDPKGRLIEMEVQGPLVTLKPGEETHLNTSWEVYRGGLEKVLDRDRGRGLEYVWEEAPDKVRDEAKDKAPENDQEKVQPKVKKKDRRKIFRSRSKKDEGEKKSFRKRDRKKKEKGERIRFWRRDKKAGEVPEEQQ